MKIISLFLFTLLITSCGTKISESNNFKTSDTFDHISHIRKESQKSPLYRKELDKYRDKTQPKFFVDYVIKNLLKNSEDKKYITDRRLLRKLNNDTCWDNYLSINDTLSNGDKCEIEIKLQNFEHTEHKVIYDKESGFLISVDGKHPFGAVYTKYPKYELKSLTIRINDKEIDTNFEEYKNLYNPNFCNFGMNVRIIRRW
jgi:hypothetical protein